MSPRVVGVDPAAGVWGGEIFKDGEVSDRYPRQQGPTPAQCGTQTAYRRDIEPPNTLPVDRDLLREARSLIKYLQETARPLDPEDTPDLLSWHRRLNALLDRLPDPDQGQGLCGCWD